MGSDHWRHCAAVSARWRYQRPTQRLVPSRNYLAALTWETLDTIRRSGAGRSAAGVQTAEDAELAVQHGVDVIWATNHGGRQIDHAQGTLDTLPVIVAAANGKADHGGGAARRDGRRSRWALMPALGRLQAGSAAGGKGGSYGCWRFWRMADRRDGLLGVTSVAWNKLHLRGGIGDTAARDGGWVNMPVGFRVARGPS